MWRHHHYQAIVAAYESQAQHEQVCLSYLQIYLSYLQIYLSYLQIYTYEVCSTNSVVSSVVFS